MDTDIPLLMELVSRLACLNYKHLAPTELKAFALSYLAYIPEDDQKHDVVYMRTETGSNLANSFNELKWRRVNDERLSNEVKNLIGGSGRRLMSNIGAIIMGVFAAIWWLVGVRASGHASPLTYGIPLVVTGLIVIAASVAVTAPSRCRQKSTRGGADWSESRAASKDSRFCWP